MEMIAERAQRIGAVKGFAIGPRDRPHGFHATKSELRFADSIHASFPGMRFDCLAIDAAAPFVRANLMILRSAGYSIGKISARRAAGAEAISRRTATRGTLA